MQSRNRVRGEAGKGACFLGLQQRQRNVKPQGEAKPVSGKEGGGGCRSKEVVGEVKCSHVNEERREVGEQHGET